MAITTQDFDNAERDLKTVSATSNSRDPDTLAPIQNYNTRLGDQVDTLAGRLAKLGYLPPLAYTSGIVFTANDNTKTIEREGFIYAPLPSQMPFTTTGIWGSDSNAFFAIQNIIGVGAQFATVADLIAGDAIGSAVSVDWANYLGQKVSIVVNSADYVVKTITQAATDGDVIDGRANHALADGIHVAILNESVITPEMLGLVNNTGEPYNLKTLIYDVIICYGQSNTVGFAGQPNVPAVDDVATPTPGPWSMAYDPATNSIVTISNTMNHLNYFLEGGGSRGNAWTAFANAWVERTGRGAVIINAARGGATISQLQKGNASPVAPDPVGDANYYQRMVDGYTATIAAMGSQNLPVGNTYFLFHQGETDQRLGTNAVDYRNLLNQLATDVFADIPAVSKFGVQIVGCPDSRPQESWERIQSAQWAAVRYGAGAGFTDNMAVVSDVCPTFTKADGQYNPADLTHYSQRGYNQMGEAAAEGLHQWVRQGSTYSASRVDSDKRAAVSGTGYQALQLVNGMASWDGASWKLLRNSNTPPSTAIYPCHIQRIDLGTDRIRFVMSGKQPVTYGMMADLNIAGVEQNIIADVRQWNNGSDEWGFDVEFYADLEFGVAAESGVLFTGSPLSHTGGGTLIDAAITTSGAGGGTVTLDHPAIKHAPKAGYYSSAGLEAGQVGVRPNSGTQTVIIISGTSQVATVSMQKVPLTRAMIEGLPQITVRLTAFVSDDL